MTMTVDRDETVLAIKAVLNELHEQQTRLRTRHHLLSHVGAHALDQRIPVPREVIGVTPADAQREMAEIDRELAALARRIDAEHARLTLADVAAQETIVEAELPAYRQLVDARDRAKAVLDKREDDIRAFLTDLRRRGVFRPMPGRDGPAPR
jgi:hypothetical protein